MRLSTKLTIAMSLAVGIFYVSVRSAAADQLGFAADATGTLYSVDLTTAAATPIGATGQLLEGLAISPNGSLFGTDNLSNLFSISKTTGAATLIGNTGILNNGSPDIEGLTFRGSTLIGTDFSNLGDQHNHCRSDCDHQLFAGPRARDGTGEPECDRRRQ
jgi:hypothetical protein